MLLFFLVLRSACVGAAGRPCIIGRILGVVAQVSDPRAVAVARREVDAVRRSQHLFQVALAVGQRLPQIEVDTALSAASRASCSFTERMMSEARPGFSAAASGRTGGMDST